MICEATGQTVVPFRRSAEEFRWTECPACGALLDVETLVPFDPISGRDYSTGDCEACGRTSTRLLATNVESGGCTDRIPVCPSCRHDADAPPEGEHRT